MASNRKRLLAGIWCLVFPVHHVIHIHYTYICIYQVPRVYVSWCKWHLLSRFSLRPLLLPSLDVGYVTAQPTPLCFLLYVPTFVQTKYTVVNRDTGELYDVREIDTSMPYRYSVLPHNMRVPSKARQLLGINEQPTHVPPKAAKVTCGLLL